MKLIKTFICLFLCNISAYAQDIFGYWQIDFPNSAKPQTALLVYEYKGLVFGKVVAIYNEKGEIIDTPALGITKATGVENSPALCGLDIIFNLQKNGEEYTQGTVIDPDNGNSFSCSIWLNESGKLVLRGEVLFFGEDKYLQKVSPKNLKTACIIKDPKPNIPQLSFWSL